MYNSKNLSTLLMNFMFWLTTIVFLNLLWIVGVILGGVILGIGPATLAMTNVFK